MNIYAKEGTKVKFINDHVTEDNIKWGSHSNPEGLLKDGKTYTIDRTEVHSWHTKVFLKEVSNTSFNSVWFEEIILCPND